MRRYQLLIAFALLAMVPLTQQASVYFCYPKQCAKGCCSSSVPTLDLSSPIIPDVLLRLRLDQRRLLCNRQYSNGRAEGYQRVHLPGK